MKLDKYFMPFQAGVIRDTSPLVIIEKSRQIGLSYAVSYKAVILAGNKAAKLDVWVMSRDEIQARQFMLYCKRWARVLKFAATDLGGVLINSEKDISAQALKFANGLCIYCLSSNPDAIIGKTGHVILDEFAPHKEQRVLYSLAKPVTQWGGTLTILSTHRGVGTVFYEIIRDIKERNNPMGWSLHTIPIQLAVEQGLVEKINAATGKSETNADWLARIRRECIDEEQWLQEYCCIAADEASAFISYDFIRKCEDATAWRPLDYLLDCKNPLYLGFDVARKHDLSVIDIEEKVGDVLWERHRIEMRGITFSEQRTTLYQLLRLPQVRRCCIDETGLGKQIAEEAQREFGWKIWPITFTQQSKSDLAYPLRAAHEDGKLRYRRDEKLASDLRGIKKTITVGGNERFEGESGDSHCDRFWAKALAVCAAAIKNEVGAMVG